MKTRRDFIRNCTLGGAYLALQGQVLSCATKGKSKKPPNVLFIFSDDHAAQAISAYGSRINKTPNIDRIAREGMIFRNCFVTNSICAPSRAVILTGKYSHLNGVIDNRKTFDGSQQTFPKLLQQNGYQTAMIGKWHLKTDPTGFDYWNVLGGQGTYYNPVMGTSSGKVKHTGYTTDIITDLSLDWLEKARDPEKPFMLMYQHKAPHRAWAPEPEHFPLYDDTSVPEPPSLFDDYQGRGTPAHTQEMTVANHMNSRDKKLIPPNNLTEEQLEKWNAFYGPANEEYSEREDKMSKEEKTRWNYQRYIKNYLRCVASVDDNIGRLLDYLDTSGLAENTIVIYNSDQGFYLGEHGWYDKRFMYEESLRMPLVVRWPGVIEPGTENSDIALNLDFAPTFLDIAGAQAPSDMQGQSLLPLLQGRSPGNWRESMYYHYYEYPSVHMVHRHRGVRTRRYKLIHFYQIDEWELYDLEKDPEEMNSVYSDPAYAGIVEELKAELERLKAHYKDTGEDPE
ncbi:sulfatase [Gemmatimonadota bacterium]